MSRITSFLALAAAALLAACGPSEPPKAPEPAVIVVPPQQSSKNCDEACQAVLRARAADNAKGGPY